MEVNQPPKSTPIFSSDQGAVKSEQPRKRGRPRKVVEPIVADYAASGSSEPGEKPGFIWPFPRFAFTPEISRKSIAFDTAHLKSAGTKERDAEISDVVVRGNGSGGSGSGVAHDVEQPVKKRRGRPPKHARVLDESGNLPVIVQPSEANKVQVATQSESQTLANLNSVGEVPVKKRRGRPPKLKTLD